MNVNKEKDGSYWIDGSFITYEASCPRLTLMAYTVCDMHNPLNLEKLEACLDRSAIVKASKIDEQDPPRRLATQFNGVLVDLVNKSRRSDVYIQSRSGGKYPFNTAMRLKKGGQIGPDIEGDRGYSYVYIQMNTDEIREKDAVEFKKLFLDLCISLSSFYGYATESSMETQRELYLALSVENVRQRKTTNLNIELPDIYWLNYYGPAYVKHWGQAKVHALESIYNVIRDERGGVLVQVEENPVFADQEVKQISDYAFKKAIYEVLGYDIFVHETHKRGKPGENVPTLQIQREYC